jgi:hypothetical protein
MLTAPGTVTITYGALHICHNICLTLLHSSGSNAPITIDASAGITTLSAPMGLGAQTFALSRDGQELMSGTGDLQISDTCTVNNFNAFVGVIKPPAPAVTVTKEIIV